MEGKREGIGEEKGREELGKGGEGKGGKGKGKVSPHFWAWNRPCCQQTQYVISTSGWRSTLPDSVFPTVHHAT